MLGMAEHMNGPDAAAGAASWMPAGLAPLRAAGAR
jgi:hypothetical protein